MLNNVKSSLLNFPQSAIYDENLKSEQQVLQTVYFVKYIFRSKKELHFWVAFLYRANQTVTVKIE
jgi:hypothetical protein